VKIRPIEKQRPHGQIHQTMLITENAVKMKVDRKRKTEWAESSK
jgi:hypothetical protein